MKKKMALDQKIVKYIFTGVKSSVALGEDGYIVYNFDTMYPANLAIFVPIEVERSNYSNVFPKSFEDYFRDLDLELSRLSLIIERGNIFNRFAKTEFIAGQIVKRVNTNFTIFRFDELIDPSEKKTLLCRTAERDLSAKSYEAILSTSDSNYSCEWAKSVDGANYLYWYLPVNRLFNRKDRELYDFIPIMLESLCR